jgi:hypothetical protein
MFHDGYSPFLPERIFLSQDRSYIMTWDSGFVAESLPELQKHQGQQSL